ncbi:MAG: hypothetical protein GWM92_05140 [Gemmatimonadetes bacterium]|nr:hypothetical protein [Gemmatimonadota bacterium]NIU30385.1 hypothetical protein [Gemmatimonadota bacterium]NIU35263.1 hypothetical protein [Gemmatimonadota bacterium]NIV60778.1 hypothetical protein [Gemmatimonadota bacterium]NIV82162.1 hypothetical protein [Gemmatimonadota bacterium]
MIAGMPVSAWILLLVSVGLPLVIVLVFFTAHRKERRERRGAGAAAPGWRPFGEERADR